MTTVEAVTENADEGCLMEASDELRPWELIRGKFGNLKTVSLLKIISQSELVSISDKKAAAAALDYIDDKCDTFLETHGLP